MIASLYSRAQKVWLLSSPKPIRDDEFVVVSLVGLLAFAGILIVNLPSAGWTGFGTTVLLGQSARTVFGF